MLGHGSQLTACVYKLGEIIGFDVRSLESAPCGYVWGVMYGHTRHMVLISSHVCMDTAACEEQLNPN